jgi:hypothetical protein
MGSVLRLRWAVVACLVLAVAAAVSASAGGPVSAAEPRIVYTFSGVTFDDGGTVSGSFIFDPNIPCAIPYCSTSGAYSAMSISTSGMGSGGFADPLAYRATDLTNVTSNSQMGFTSSRIMFLAFGSPLGVAGSISVVPSVSVEWTGSGPTRYVTAGSVVGVAETTTSTTSSTTSTTSSTTSTTSSTTSTTSSTTSTTSSTTSTTSSTTSTTSSTTSTTTTTVPESTTTTAPTTTTSLEVAPTSIVTTSIAPTTTVASTTTEDTLPVTGPSDELRRSAVLGVALLLLGIVMLSGAAAIGQYRSGNH